MKNDNSEGKTISHHTFKPSRAAFVNFVNSFTYFYGQYTYNNINIHYRRGCNYMEMNVGKVDKYFRIILGIVIAILGLRYNSWWGALGIIPILTGIFSRCALYSLFGICTLKEDNN
jgi:hypothetical protein